MASKSSCSSSRRRSKRDIFSSISWGKKTKIHGTMEDFRGLGEFLFRENLKPKSWRFHLIRVKIGLVSKVKLNKCMHDFLILCVKQFGSIQHYYGAALKQLDGFWWMLEIQIQIHWSPYPLIGLIHLILGGWCTVYTIIMYMCICTYYIYNIIM